jgi:hypothetical protein
LKDVINKTKIVAKIAEKTLIALAFSFCQQFSPEFEQSLLTPIENH